MKYERFCVGKEAQISRWSLSLLLLSREESLSIETEMKLSRFIEIPRLLRVNGIDWSRISRFLEPRVDKQGRND